MEIKSLSSFFRTRMEHNPAHAKGVHNLRKFALQFGAEVQLDETQKCVRFCNNKLLFVVRCDIDSTDQDKVVYQGFIKTFGPETTIAYTDYVGNIHAVLVSLQTQLDALRASSRKSK